MPMAKLYSLYRMYSIFLFFIAIGLAYTMALPSIVFVFVLPCFFFHSPVWLKTLPGSLKFGGLVVFCQMLVLPNVSFGALRFVGGVSHIWQFAAFTNN